MASTTTTSRMNVYTSQECLLKGKLRKIRSGHNGGYEDTILWDMTTRSPVEAHRRFGGTYCFRLQDLKVIKASN
jgi:hypothetical protein